MNWWENIAKGASEFGQMAANPKTYANLRNLVNTGGEALYGGYQSLVKDPHVGPYAAALGYDAYEYANAPILHGFQKPSMEQMQNQKKFLQDTRQSLEVSKAMSDERERLDSQGDIYDIRNSLAEQAVNIPMYAQQAISFVGEGVTGGLGDDWDKSWEEKGYKDYYESFERENKNKMFFGNLPYIPGDTKKAEYGREKLAKLPKEIVDRIPDAAFKDIYEGNVSSQYNLSQIVEDAQKMQEFNAASTLIEEQFRNGDIKTREEADKAIEQVRSNQALRDFTAEAVTDPLTYLDPFKGVGNIGKSVLKSAKIPNVKNLKNLPGVLSGSKSASVLSGKVSSVVNESDDVIKSIDNIIKEAETPQIKEPGAVSEGISQLPEPTIGTPEKPFIGSIWNEASSVTKPKSKLTEAQFHKQKRQIIDNPSIQHEQKQQLLKQLESQTEFKKVEPKIGKLESQAAKQEVRNIQSQIPEMDNKDAADVLLNQTRKAMAKEADEVANGVWENMKKYGGPDVVDGPLVSTYTPPKVGLTTKNTMQANPALSPAPIEVQFRNPIQKLMYELSLPYNRAVIEGYGMDFAKSKDVMSNMTKNFAEPLTKFLTGGFNEGDIQTVKRMMGMAGSELAKKSINHVPGTPLHFDNLKVSEMLDNFLLTKNKVPSTKKSVLGALKEAPTIKFPKASAESAGEEIVKGYDNISNYFTGIGIPEQTAKKAAVYYNKVIERSGLSGAGGIAEAAGEGITAGKAFNTDVLNELDGLDKSIAIELHEDFHQLFDYMRATTDNPRAVPGIIKDALTKDLPDVGNKLFNQIKKSLKSIDTHDSIILDEAMSYFVQTKNELRKGIFTDNPVTRTFASIMRRANNGDEAARRLLDNFEGVEQAIRTHGDEFEQGIINELKATTLPDGQNAWDTINRVDPTNMKGIFPGANYGKGKASLGEYQGFLEDSTKRMSRLQEIMGSQEVVYRGTTKAPSTGKPRTNPISNDQMYGPGTYTSTNPQQAFGYTGLGKMPDQIAKSFQGSGTGDMRAYYQGLERPLFWDEQVPMDLFETVIESKNKTIQKAVEIIGGEEQVAIMSMEEFVKDMPEAIQMVLNPKLQKAWKYDDLVASQTKHGEEVFNLLMDEIYKKSGYDGFVGPATDDALDLVKGGGFEVVPFEGHNLLERTKEMRELGKKSPKTKNFTLTPDRAYVDDGPVDLADLTDQINNIQNRTSKGINYHINRDIE